MNFFKMFNTTGNLGVIRQFTNLRHRSQLNIFFHKFYSSSPKYDLSLEIHGKSLKNYILALEKEYKSLTTENFLHKSRRVELQPIIKILENRKKFVDSIPNLNEFLDSGDEELIKLAKEEKNQFERKINQLDETLLATLIPCDNESFDSLILEVQAGVGGQEAMLFAKEIFNMYSNFATYKGWDVELAEYLNSDAGGIRSASVIVNGNSSYQHFRHEAGIHRVQRVPATEKAGRVHTSTVAVAVLPQPSDIEVNINPNDLKVETKRASGAGGQHVNKTESAVRITHLPTKIAVECQEDRSQIKNRKVAMARLRAILYQKQLDAQTTSTTEARKNQIKNRNRNEKIRTYNFKDDRITDHRLGISVYNLYGFFEGADSLNNLIEQLESNYRIQSLLDIVNSTELK